MQHFEQELDGLKQALLKMASRAEGVVSRAIQAVVERNDDLARKVQEEDAAIDQLEIEVDEQAISLLSKAPLASDLRFITVAMKISNDLERVGDEATTISRRSITLSREPQLKEYVDIPKMAAIAISMLKDALDAFVARDPAKARAVIPLDKEVDQMHKGLQKELAEFMAKSSETINRCVNLMVISKSLERIADHATNIAEEVVYLCEALDVRHAGVKDSDSAADSEAGT